MLDLEKSSFDRRHAKDRRMLYGRLVPHDIADDVGGFHGLPSLSPQLQLRSPCTVRYLDPHSIREEFPEADADLKLAKPVPLPEPAPAPDPAPEPVPLPEPAPLPELAPLPEPAGASGGAGYRFHFSGR